MTENSATQSYSHTYTKKGVHDTITDNGVFFHLNNLEQSIVYQLDEIITLYEQTSDPCHNTGDGYQLTLY